MLKLTYLVWFRKWITPIPNFIPNFESQKKVVDNFSEHFLKENIMVVNILENKQNLRTLLIPVHPSIRPSTRTIKVFFQFFLANYRLKIETCVFVFYTDLIKIKRNQMDPSGSAFALSLRGIKVFETFKKSDLVGYFWRPNFGSSITYKLERLSNGPSRVLLSQFPSGDK